MALDTRGHEIPAGDSAWGYKQDMEAFSRSVSSVQTAPDFPTAETRLDAMVLDGLDVDGTMWWITTESALYVYRQAATEFVRVRDETTPVRPRQGRTHTKVAMNAGANVGSNPATARVYGVAKVGVVDFPRMVTYHFNLGVSPSSTDSSLVRGMLLLGAQTSLPASPAAMTTIDVSAAAWDQYMSAYMVFRNPSTVDTRNSALTATVFVPAGSSAGTAAVACAYGAALGGASPTLADVVGIATEVSWVEVDEVDAFAASGGAVY